jgi:peptidoglycan/xylan/chitin deacetylase (PgdA/CDA1 family)
MNGTYLIRFDDLCPTMNWDVWDRIEHGLADLPIRPILAVVPDNHDPVLQVGPANDRFWERVRAWDQRGWTVAYHGFQHTYITDRSGIVGLNHRSEFAGLPYEVQAQKISNSVAIMAAEGLSPRAWTAPSHSFDRTTVAALRANGIRVINEGFYPLPHVADGMTWVPHQMWRFRPIPAGVWTFGYHINGWTDRDADDLLSTIGEHHDRIADLEGVVRAFSRRRMNPVEPWAAKAYVHAIRARVGARRLLEYGRG